MKNNNVIAIIPARGGSKGIHRKNLACVDGKPLVVHSIEHAKASQEIDRIFVSTDDPEIAEVSKDAGAEVPFLRPKEFAEDHVLDLPVFQHALDFFRTFLPVRPSIIVHLRPTAPYRKPSWIDDAVRSLQQHPDVDSVRSVSPPDQHPYRMFQIDSHGFLVPLMRDVHPTPYLLRRQDLPSMYYYNCVIDVTRYETIIEKNSMTGDRILPFIMRAEDSFDIDGPRDLKIAELFLKDFR